METTLSRTLSVKEIKAVVADEMSIFENKFKQSLKTDVSLLDKITHYIVKRKGKQMRPMFVFLTARLFGDITDKTYSAASLVELIHTATLVHDDVVDDADKRRGFFSINALWKNKIAVLVGDFLLSRALVLSTKQKHYDLLHHVGTAVSEMSEGELLQLEKARKLDITEDVYYEIIRQKTAALIATCCACGASAANVSEEDVENLRLFGEKVGMAFQIKDDLFDFGGGKNIGKPVGIDIKEKKMTLPLIYALQNTEPKEKKEYLRLIKYKNKNKKSVSRVIDFVLNSGGIEYAHKKMMEFRDEALSLLNKYPDNEAKIALESLVNYTVEREK